MHPLKASRRLVTLLRTVARRPMMSTFTNQSETGRTVDRLSRGRKQLLEAAAVAIGALTMVGLWVVRRVSRNDDGAGQ
jgi:hypothetical protein